MFSCKPAFRSCFSYANNVSEVSVQVLDRGGHNEEK